MRGFIYWCHCQNGRNFCWFWYVHVQVRTCVKKYLSHGYTHIYRKEITLVDIKHTHEGIIATCRWWLWLYHSVISMNNRSTHTHNTHTCTSQKDKDSTHAWSNNLVRSISSKSFGIKVTDHDKKNEKQDLTNFTFQQLRECRSCDYQSLLVIGRIYFNYLATRSSWLLDY